MKGFLQIISFARHLARQHISKFVSVVSPKTRFICIYRERIDECRSCTDWQVQIYRLWSLTKSCIFWHITPCSPLKVKCAVSHFPPVSYIIRNFGKVISLVATCFRLVPYLAHSSILRMGATYSSEKSADFQWTTRRYIPEDITLHNHSCENLKSYTGSWMFPQAGRCFGFQRPSSQDRSPQLRSLMSGATLEVTRTRSGPSSPSGLCVRYQKQGASLRKWLHAAGRHGNSAKWCALLAS
jgi:hypothetical protein